MADYHCTPITGGPPDADGALAPPPSWPMSLAPPGHQTALQAAAAMPPAGIRMECAPPRYAPPTTEMPSCPPQATAPQQRPWADAQWNPPLQGHADPWAGFHPRDRYDQAPAPAPGDGTTPSPVWFPGPGGLDADESITGSIARQMIQNTRRNMVMRAKALGPGAQPGKGPTCPAWDGKDPGRTLRLWLRDQIHWQLRTSDPPWPWGMALFDQLPQDSLARSQTEQITMAKLYGDEGYVEIVKLNLCLNQAYL